MRFPALLRQKTIFPFLFPLFFVLRAERRYLGYIDAGDLLLWVALYSAGTILVFSLCKRLLKDPARAGFLTLCIQLFFFFWAPYQDAMMKVFKLQPGAFMGLLLTGTAVVSVLTAWIPGRWKENVVLRINSFLNVLMLIYVLVECSLLGYKTISQKRWDPLPEMVSDGVRDSAARKYEVYCLVFDEYANTEALRDNIGFDNSEVDSFLKQKGFSVQSHSRSNYMLTPFSISSMLNGCYLPFKEASTEAYNECLSQINDNATTRLFTAEGYLIRNQSLFRLEQAREPYYVDVSMLPVKSRLITANTFYDRVLTKIHKDDKFPYFRFTENFYYNMLHYNENVLKYTLLEAKKETHRPKFVYAHIFSPHTPYYFGENGNLLPIDSVAALSEKMDAAYYGYAVRHSTIPMLKELVSTILHYQRERAIIVVIGDHGMRHRVADKARNMYFRNFNAIYFPDGDYRMLYDSISNVNLMRVVANKALGFHFPLLKDSSILLKQTNAAD